MKTCWVLSQDISTGCIDPKIISDVAPSWGSWSTWREFQIDNVISHDLKKSKELINRAMHAVCNLYVPKHDFIELGRPVGVKLYEGEFKDNVIINKEDLVALNLVAATHDIVLMLGFDVSPVLSDLDILEQRMKKAYRHNIRTIINDNTQTQFVLVDYLLPLAENFQDLDNLSIDSVESVVNLL